MAKFYVTTPIFYPNARPHLGNVYPTVLADALARHHRIIGDETYFLAGTDENTQKFIDAARKIGKEPIVFLDEIVAEFQKTFKSFDISYDQFIRTTDQRVHWPGITQLWNKWLEQDDIYERSYEGLYCTGHEAFMTEKDLVNGLCPDHNSKPTLLKETNYFFRLSKYADKVAALIESDELLVLPQERKNEVLSFIRGGLDDISFSRPRNPDWPESVGVPVPNDSSHVMYVWADALANYITAVGYGRDDVLYQKWWPADLHVIGKDLIRFHAVYWPAMLLSAGLPLPKAILATGLIQSGGKKMSKTLGNVIDPIALAEKYGPEAVRYYLLRHVSPFSDGDMTEAGFHETYTGNLANGIGNLVARVMKLAEDNLAAPITEPERTQGAEEVATEMAKYSFNTALDLIFSLVSFADQRMAKEMPYKVVKTDPEQGRTMIAGLVAELWNIGTLLAPFMPETSAKILEAVRTNKKPDNLFKRLDA